MATVMSISAAPNLRFSPGATVMTVGVTVGMAVGVPWLHVFLIRSSETNIH